MILTTYMAIFFNFNHEHYCIIDPALQVAFFDKDDASIVLRGCVVNQLETSKRLWMLLRHIILSTYSVDYRCFATVINTSSYLCHALACHHGGLFSVADPFFRDCLPPNLRCTLVYSHIFFEREQSDHRILFSFFVHHCRHHFCRSKLSLHQKHIKYTQWLKNNLVR